MEEEQTFSPFSTYLDNLTEKKRATRIDALQNITSLLQNMTVDLSELQNNEFSLREGISNGLKAGEEEKILASKMLSNYAILIGTESNELIPLYFATLTKLSHEASPNVLIHALKAQSILLFVGGSELETEAYLDYLKSLMEKASESVLPTVLSCWSLLLTTIPNAKIHDTYLPQTINIIFSVLRSSSNTDVRLAAGEAIALSVNSYRAFTLKQEEDFFIHDLEGYIPVEELLEVMEELKTEKERKISVKNQKILKKGFKNIYKGVIDYSCPVEKLKISASVISFDTWPKVIQIKFFRDFLATGLYAHLSKNDLFSEIFSYDLAFDVNVNKSISPAAKELMRKKSQKDRALEKKKSLSSSLQVHSLGEE